MTSTTSIASDAANLEAALANFVDAAESLDLSNPASVTGFGSAFTQLGLAAAAGLADVGPFSGSLGLSAAIGSILADGAALSAATTPGGELAALTGLLGDAFGFGGSLAQLAAAAAAAEGTAAAAEAALGAVAFFAAAAAVVALFHFALDRSSWLQNTLSQWGQGLKDPLIINLHGGALNLTAESSTSPYFSWSENEFANNTGWVGIGAAFLIEIPASGLPVTAGSMITSFAQLAALTNGSGVLDSADAGYSSLGVWIPATGQIETLAQAGIESIATTYTSTDEAVNGNTINEISTATFADGSSHEIAAVSFAYSPTYTEYTGPDTPSAAAAALPQLDGYGNMTDLQEAMTQNPTLLAMVQNFVALPVTDVRGGWPNSDSLISGKSA